MTKYNFSCDRRQKSTNQPKILTEKFRGADDFWNKEYSDQRCALRRIIRHLNKRENESQERRLIPRLGSNAKSMAASICG
jgi:hypothetical protein